MNELTQRGISALRSGDRAEARDLLREAVRIDPDDAAAWLWLTGALDEDEERIDCLNQVLRIDPNNQPAARGLSQIRARQKEQDPAEQRSSKSPYYGQTKRAEAETEAVTTAQSDSTDSDMVPPPAGPAIVANLREDFTFSENDLEESIADSAGEASGDEASGDEASGNEAPVADIDARQAWVYEIPPASFTGTGSPVAQPSITAVERSKKARTAAEPLHTIFRTRPSQVPALLGFWFFLIGTIIVAILLRDAPELALGLSTTLGLLLMLIVVYALVRNFSMRYELTNHYLSLRFRGQNTRVAVGEITMAECRQTFFQRLIATGDVHLKATVNHELANLRMRNIPDCRRRVEQIHAAVASAGVNTTSTSGNSIGAGGGSKH